jgi:hypothetical protein
MEQAMKKKPTTPTKTAKPFELDGEPIADLDVNDDDKDAIRGGGRGGPITI